MGEKKLTGYPSIDKPWLQYYSEEAIHAPLPEGTIFDYMRACNAGYEDDTALNYYGRRITYRRLFAQVERAAQAFRSLGVARGDVVSVCMPNTLEGVYAIYAINCVGATICTIDPRTAATGIQAYVNEVHSRKLVVVDICLEKVAEILQDTELDSVVAVPITASLPLLKRAMYSFVNRSRSRNIAGGKQILSWREFIALGAGMQRSDMQTSKHNEAPPALIAHTGGTTGIPKGAILSNDCINALVSQGMATALKPKRQQSVLDIMPLFSSYGLISGLHNALCNGQKVYLISKFEPEDFGCLLLKYRPNHVMGVPAFWEDLCEDQQLSKVDLSFLRSAIIGGDKLMAKTEAKINSFLQAHGCQARVIKGYGMTETGSVVTLTVSNACNKPGSVGIPLVHTSVKIVSPNSCRELEFDKTGEICFTGPTIMAAYWNDTKATQATIQLHDDGKRWLHSGDLGHIDHDGVLYVTDRLKRVIIASNGHTIFPSLSEGIIQNDPAVSDCAVVGVQDSKRDSGTIPTAYVVLKRGILQDERHIEKRLDEHCRKVLPACDCPYAYTFLGSLPLTPIGKVDYRALEQMDLNE